LVRVKANGTGSSWTNASFVVVTSSTRPEKSDVELLSIGG